MSRLNAEVVVNTVRYLVSGPAPFLATPAGGLFWMVTGRDGANCVTLPDGFCAVFPAQSTVILLAKELNDQVAA